jgi:DNA invertase Pin-like site-specific DNA recombinase
MNLGYARVSTADQAENGHGLEAQRQALEAAGCERIFADTASGGKAERPELKRLFEQLRAGDVVIVYKLDRLSRSLKDVLELVERIDKAGAGFKSLTENLDTTSAAGRAMMQMVGVFAEFERGVLRERTLAGLREARRKGKVGGRPRKLDDHQQQEIIKQVTSGQKSAADCARLFKVSQSSVSRLLAKVQKAA